jgi:predicted aspartyl protease
MLQLTLRDELPFVTLRVVHRGDAVDVANVLLDTGSASTLLNADIAATIGIFPEPADPIRTLRGVGGREVVFARHVDRVEIDGMGLDGFEVEIGGMDYGFEIGGILGMDFLRKAGAVVDLGGLTLAFHTR